jgi:putative ABC transport system permease protein
MTKRFGADLMVVPEGYTAKYEALLLRGEENYFYFDKSLVSEISNTKGVTCASPQFFLSSLSTECCDDFVQLIAFDPDTDFVIQPWIAEERNKEVLDGHVIAGNDINIRPDKTVKLFNHLFPVAARLSKSASGLDTSIFMSMNTMNYLMEQAHQDHQSFIADSEPEGSISAILVQLDGDVNPPHVATLIKDNNKGVDVLVAKSIFSAITGTLKGFIAYIHLFQIVLWIVAVIVLAAVFSGSINERKKEFAVLRALGATRKKLVEIVLTESALTAIAGSIAGVVVATLIVFPFNVYIADKIELPYIQANTVVIFGILALSLVLSFAVAPLASVYSAARISKAETYFTMREGE